MKTVLNEECPDLFNLLIIIDTTQRTFTDFGPSSAVDEIEMHGRAITAAKKMLGGEWRVLCDGTLVKGSGDSSEGKAAIIDISENLFQIMAMSGLADGPLKKSGEPGIFAHQLADYICHDGKNFFIKSIRRFFKLEANIDKICRG